MSTSPGHLDCADPRGSTPPPANRRLRLRLALSASVLVLAATISALLLVVIASRASLRLDLTSTREHQLSARSRAVLARLDRPVTFVLAADFSQVDRAVARRTLDVIDTFRAADKKFSATIIDTSSPSGLAEYDALLRRLAEESAPAIAAQRAEVDAALQLAGDASKEMNAAGESLHAIRDLVAGATGAPSSTPGGALDAIRRFLDDQAAVCRAFAGSLDAASTRAREALAAPPEGMPVPPLDGIARGLRVEIGRLAADLPGLNSSLDRFALAEDAPAEARARARLLSTSVAALRDRLARAISRIDAMTPLPVVTVARAVQRTRAAMLVAEPASTGAQGAASRRDLAAIDPDVLLPAMVSAGSGSGGGGANVTPIDTRARTEELLAAGLATFAGDVRPRAVFVHAGEKRLAPSFAPWWGNVAARLSLKGFDLDEWPVMLDEQPPIAPRSGSSEAAGSGAVAEPPVVYVLVGLEVRRAEDAKRMSKLAGAGERLIREGRSVLVSCAPSTLPAGGAPDPMVEYLEPLGLRARTGLLLMEEARSVSPGGAVRFVAPDFSIVNAGSDQAIASAVTGLNTYLPWVVPLEPSAEPPKGVSLEPVLTVGTRPSIWAESEWLTFWQTPIDQRARAPQPMNDSPRDVGSPWRGDRWLVAAAIERRSEAFARTQRVVVIGCPAWFFDIIADAQAVIDGRSSYAAPGNFELLASSIAWLAEREDLIARSAEASSLPTIPSIEPGRLTGVRWALIAGLPLLTLVLGVVWRLLRG
ncbi:MAG: hypothetical protein AB7K52_03865 [Phycisphaerales bacterium]